MSVAPRPMFPLPLTALFGVILALMLCLPSEALALKVIPGTVQDGQTAQGSINRNKAVDSDDIGTIAQGKADGIYYGTGEGFKSEVTVAVTVQDEQVVNVQVVAQADDQSYFNHAEGVEDKVVALQRVNVNAMAGATYSSKGILSAVENALGPDARVPVTSTAWFQATILGCTAGLVVLAALFSHKAHTATTAQRRRRAAERQRLATQLAFFIVCPSVFASALAGIKYFFQAIYEADMDGVAPVFAFNSLVAVLVCLVAFTVAFGRVFCGFACSFGLLGDLLWRARQFACQALHIKTRPLGKHDSKRTQLIGRLMRCLKYAVLATVLFIVYMGYADVIDEGSPWVAFAQLASLSTRRLTVVSVALLVLIVVGNLVRERFFCRYICPMGAVFSLLPCMPWARMHRDDSTCPARCQCCHNACPMGTAPKEGIRAGECVMCGRCQQACPRSNIRYGIGPKKDEGCWPTVVLLLNLALLALLWLVGATQYLPRV